MKHRPRWLAGLAALTATAVIAGFGEFDSDDPRLRIEPGEFTGRFLAVSDADMSATAYADGQLEPLTNGRDELTIFTRGCPSGTVAASNSVIGWPQVVDVSDDGRYAVVAESRGPAPRGVSAYADVTQDFPPGTTLSLFSLDDMALTDQRTSLGHNLRSVEFAPNGRFVVIASEDAELIIAETANGRIGDVHRYALDLPLHRDDEQRTITSLHLSPDGVTLAANIANHRVQFYRLTLGSQGIPVAVTRVGEATDDLGRRLSVGKWTPDGRHFVIADTNGGASAAGMLVQGPGALIVLRPSDSAPVIVSRAAVGRFPEGFDISPDGTRVAAVNMERTYLPQNPLLTFWPGRRAYSVSLLALDPGTGHLTELDRIRQAGILPEDLIFDAEGRNLAVAVFHRRTGPARSQGFIDFFTVHGDELASQGVTQPVMRGAHDLVLAD